MRVHHIGGVAEFLVQHYFFLFVYTDRRDAGSKSSGVFIQGLAMNDDGLSYFKKKIEICT